MTDEYDLNHGSLPLPGSPSPATMLTAAFRAVDFQPLHGEAEADLARWSERTTDTLSVLVLTGAAGVGKTRLLLEYGGRLRGRGWHAGFWPSFSEPRITSIRRPTWIVLDHADVQPRLRDHLEAWQAAAEPGGPPLRVVLVARAIGEWWTTLAGDPRVAAIPSLATMVKLDMTSVELDVQARLQELATARFADALGVARPAGRADSTPPQEASPLWILAAALCDVLGTSTEETPYEAILAHEASVWRRSMQHLVGSDRLARRFDHQARIIVAALVLRGGAEDADDLAGLVTRIAGEGQREFAEVLRELYPGAEGGDWVRPLTPDLLGDLLVAQTLERASEALERMLARASDVRVEYAPHCLLRVVSRSRADHGEAWLRRLLGLDLWLYAPPVATAILFASPAPTSLRWAAILDEILQQRGDAELSWRLLPRIPARTTALLHVGVWAGVTVSRWLPPLDDLAWTELRAEVHEETALFCGCVGESLLALFWSGLSSDTIRERASVEHDPEVRRRLRRRLATLLRNRGAWMMQEGGPIAAFPMIDECIALCRELQEEEPAEDFDGILAACLDHRGIVLSAIGEPSLAIASTEESVSLYRRLSVDYPPHYRQDLAAALDNLGGRYRAAGDFARSLEVTEEALEIFRALVDADPDHNLDDFLICLGAAASRRAHAGLLERAREAIDESVALLRPLAAHHEGLRARLATALFNGAGIDRLLGRSADADRRLRELKSLGEIRGDPTPSTFIAYSPGVATYELSTVGGRLALPAELDFDPRVRAGDHVARSQALHKIGVHQEALDEAEAAASIMASRENAGGEYYDIVVLNNVANRQADAGDYQRARETTARALALAESLTALGVQGCRALRSQLRANFAVRHCELGEPSTALPLAVTAVSELRELHEQGDPEAAQYLASTLDILGRCLTGMGDDTAAAVAHEEADQFHRGRVEEAREALQLAPPVPPNTWRKRLHELIVASFTADELRAWVSKLEGDRELVTTLPEPPCSTPALADALLSAGEHRGALDPAFFVELHRALPRRSLEINLVDALRRCDETARAADRDGRIN